MKLDRRFCVAPMLDWTDRHERYFLRLISRHALLYTEMVTTGAIIHGDKERHLRFNAFEQPVALQLGGNNPRDMALCAKIAEDYGYNEVNINVGCPSDRVQNGAFGACLMANPAVIAECVAAMRDAVSIPVTVKTRIGIDDSDDYAFLQDFVAQVSAAGCETFILHARKAWLQGLSPKENRDVPPLNYSRVYQVKQEHPELEIIINGGLKTLDDSLSQLAYVDGVMLGREIYHNPYILAEVDRLFYGAEQAIPTRMDVLQGYFEYVQSQLDAGVYLGHMSRHILGLFQGQRGARLWRRYISENAYKEGAGLDVLKAAAGFLG